MKNLITKLSILLLLTVVSVTQVWAFDLYVRGIGTWDANNNTHMVDRGSNTQSLYLSLTGNTAYSFKIADGSWGTYNYGGSGSPTLGTAYALVKNGGNISFKPTVTGVYLFSVNTSTWKLTITQVKPTAAAATNVVNGTNAMFYIQGYEGLNYLVNSSGTKASTTTPLAYTGYSYVNTAKTNLTSYDRISNNPPGWTGDEATNIKTATGGELITRANAKTAAKTAATTASVTGDVLSISTTTNSTTGVYGSLQLYIQYYIDGTFTGVTYNSSTASYASIPAGGATARASTYNVSSLTNGSHTLKTVLTDGIISWVADQDNFTVAHVYSITYKDQGNVTYSGSNSASLPSTYTYGVGATLVDGVKAGYDFGGWYTASDCSSGLTTSIGTSATGAKTFYAKWTVSATNSLATAGGTGISSTSGDTNPVTLGNKYDISATVATGYTFSGWTASPVANGTFDNASSANTKVKVQNGSVTVTASATENKSTLTTSNHYDAGNPSYSAPSKSVSSIGIVTTSKITAATPSTGYTFAGWTLSSNLVVTSGNKDTDLSITVRTNGNGAAATAQANYEEDLSTTWSIAGDFNDWSTSSDLFEKSSGEATGSVAYCSMSLTGGTTYNFQVIEGGSNWKGNTGTMTRANCTDWTFEAGSYNNCGITADFSGTYIFKIDYSGTNPKVSVTYPDVYAVVGSFNSWNAETDPLDLDGDVGTAVISLDGSTTDYQFKLIDRGYWRGYQTSGKKITATESNIAIYTSDEGNNIALTADIYPSGDYTFSYNKSTNKLSVTYPTSYTVTFGKSTGGGNTTATANSTAITSGKKIVSGATVVFTKGSTSSGYTFKGWYNNSAGTGDKLVAGTPDTYTISSLGAAATVYAVYTPNTYTVSFNVNGGTASTPDSKEVTFGSEYGELPSGMTHASKVFKGWYTLSSGGTLVTASTLVSTAGNHTLYAQYEDIYDVTIQYKCGDVTLRSNSATTASATAMAADISAPEILGYEFSNWTGSNATFGNASSATTTVKASASTTITANYTAIPTVYFKNNLGWEHVYVTFDNTWVSDAPCNNGKPYFEMTQLGTSDIFSCRIPDTYVTSNYASWAWNIAFDNHGFSASENVGTFSGGFNAGEFLGRGDFDPSATMFIPYDGDSETRNGGTYYRTGCWMKYNSTDPGYKLYANSFKTGSGGSAVTGTPVLLKADIAGGFEFKAKVNFPTANYTYGFMLHKEYTKNSDAIWYTNTSDIYASTTTLPWDFTTDGASENGTRCGIHTEATGEYEFTVSFGTGKPMVNVTYPASVGDWRLAYNDRVAWSGSAHAADWYIYSRVIKAEANAEDIVSFYVSKAAGANAHVELQKCTAINALTGVETWTKQGSNLDISSITGTGIYNFKVTQNGSKVATAAYDGSYSGNFYIRTDASDGGWSNYKTSGTNTMTYSEYAEDNSGFTHYFMRYVTKGANIKFCIANDYSPCLTEYCIDDDYTEEWIEANGNVRFMWDVRTNAVSRAYISGSSVVSDRFLVLEGDNRMFDENGNALSISGLNANEMNFTDDQNWIYEATIQAKPGAKALLTAKYNNKIQYFGGSGPTNTDSVLLIGGSDANKYKIRVVYDFKTNRMIKAFIPAGEINTNLEINADLMIIREAQGDAQQVTFGASGKLSEVKTVYGAMKFNKYTVNDKAKEGGHARLNWSRYKRDLFYISFPFDVKLSDAFGFGTYGKHWIIEYYDGKERAANGFWAETETFWKFVMPSQRHDFTLKANEGYILALDLDELTESSSVWNNGVEDVYVYFPSNGDIDNIYATEKTVTIDQTGYECTINRATPDGNRTIKDSYWHMIGAPSFANYSNPLKDEKGGSTIDWSDSDGEIDWTTPSLPYLYEWNSADNTLSVTRTATFTFKAMYSYMVQYAGTSIYWSSVNAVVPSPVAPRKIDNAQADVEFRLELLQNEQKADQTFVHLTDEENVTTGYDFNYDLSKEFNGGKANIYTMITSVTDNQASLTEAAGNVLPMTEQTTVVPVGVKIATNGDYTFSIPEGTEGVGVTLIDTETGIRTSLSALDYTVSLEAGTYNDRFVIEISPIQHVATALEPSAVGDQQSDVRKLLIDGLLYIVRDGKMFDARGARVE